MIGPVSVSMPSWMSREMLIGGVGCTGGLLFGDFIASYVLTRTGWTGNVALAGSAAAKIGLGTAAWYGATKVTGGAKPLLGLAAIGCFASAVADVVIRVWPAAGSASARVGAALRGARPVAGVTLRAVGVAPAIHVRAETPSGIALGGF